MVLGRIEAQANMVIAKGELEASRMIGKTAEINGNNPIGLQLQYLETLKIFAEKNPTTIILPDSIMGKGRGFHIPKKIVEMCKKQRIEREGGKL